MALLGLLAGAETRAEGERPDASVFSLSGFGTLGQARSSSGQAEFVRDLSQPGGVSSGRWSEKVDSVIGLQGEFGISRQVGAVVQVVSRYGNEGNYDPEVMWAFVRFDPNAHLSLRGGRLGTDFFMLADSRLVGYSYLPVRPPGDYFGTLPFPHIDGVDGVATLPVGDGLLRGKLFTGYLHGEVPSLGRQWKLDGSRMSGGHIDYQTGDWLWRAGYAEVRFKRDVGNYEITTALDAMIALGVPNAVAVRNAESMAGKLSRFHSAGVVYDHGPLQMQLMLSRIRNESAVFQDTSAGYLIAGYRIGEWTPFVGYSRARSTARSLPATDGGIVDAAIAQGLAMTHTDQHTSFLGVRWDFRANMAIKAQYDAIRGSPGSIFPYARVQPGWNGRTDVLSFTLDFVF